MNRYQWIYQLGRGLNHNADFIIIFCGGVFFGLAGLCYPSIDYALIPGIMGIGSLAEGIKYIRCKEKILGDKEFSECERVVIDDKKGLEMILKKTAEKRKLEWGTLLHSHNENRTAVIDRILRDDSARKLGLARREAIGLFHIDIEKSKDLGLNGHHHYHPILGAINYSLNYDDRNSPKDWLNLLSFNMPFGPEIIAFNRHDVFIPTNPSKKEFVKASPKDIMSYLNQFN